MEIHYQLEPTDIEALQAFVSRGTPTGWMIKRPGLLIVGIAIIVSPFLFKPDHPIVSVLPVLLLPAFFFFFRKRMRVKLQKRGAAIFAPASLMTTPDGLQWAATGRSSSTAWSEVKGWGQTNTHIFVMIDGVTGHVIPKRGLSSEDVDALVADLSQYTTTLPTTAEPRRMNLLRIILPWLILLIVIYWLVYFRSHSVS